MLLHGFLYGSPIGRCILPSTGNVQTIQGTAYFCYLGQTMGQTVIWKFVEFYVTTAATGAQQAEVALLSSVDHPNRLPVTLTVLTASNALTSFSTVGVKRNLTPFTLPITSLTHLWAGFRCNTTGPTSSKPICQSLSDDWGYGIVATTLLAPALNIAGTFVANPYAASNFQGCPAMRTTLD